MELEDFALFLVTNITKESDLVKVKKFEGGVLCLLYNNQKIFVSSHGLGRR